MTLTGQNKPKNLSIDTNRGIKLVGMEPPWAMLRLLDNLEVSIWLLILTFYQYIPSEKPTSSLPSFTYENLRSVFRETSYLATSLYTFLSS